MLDHDANDVTVAKKKSNFRISFFRGLFVKQAFKKD